jgi:hypothetical protein
MAHSLLSKKRIGICGGKAVDEKTAAFCPELGKQLSKGGDYILVSGGCKKSTKIIDKLSVDWHTINSAAELLKDPDRIEARIETILPDEKDTDVEKFDIGNVIKLYGKSPQARRFAFVSSVDVLVAIGG